ncbi:hypothetical protein DINM_003543 [Dirofilaria immitis]|nr:hypothetical protein [Dirofilaria immitis]
MATVVPGEASETDDDDYDNDNSNKQDGTAEQNDAEMRNWNLNEVEQRTKWSLHVDEKLEERWRLLGYDTVRLAEQQAFMQRKHFKNLKQNLFNTQQALQVVSSTFRQIGENLARVEWNLSLLQEGAKLIPDFSIFLITNSSKE